MANNISIGRGQEKRDQIVEFIVEYIKEHGFSPSIREIGNGVGLSSTSSVVSHMNKLYEEGRLETNEAHSPRAIKVVGYKFVKE